MKIQERIEKAAAELEEIAKDPRLRIGLVVPLAAVQTRNQETPTCYRQNGNIVCGLERGHGGECSWEDLDV